MPQSKSFSSRRKDFVKSVKAKAHSEGKIFRIALEEQKETKAAKSVLLGYRNEEPKVAQRHLRRHLVQNTFIDDAELYLEHEDVHDFAVDFADVDSTNFQHKTDMTVALLDIAKPAKPRGIAKEFEVISKSTITKPFDEFEIWADDEFERCEIWEDDWEEIFDEQRDGQQKPSYSSVLRGNDGDER
ncbi:hypothetical protein D9613_010770 [Agrocybe pediades]|uniref:Uncharacterized protein n=1 Tax=Agrocybe pediades TaxID=84607 RepID=A0A8H4VKS4_9AGAR|nr:hypothetical protein D9613_010770 [Agrocybe pediades]